MKVIVADSAYDRGTLDTIKQIAKQSEDCEPFSIRKAQWVANLISYNCPQVTKPDLPLGQTLPPQ